MQRRMAAVILCISLLTGCAAQPSGSVPPASVTQTDLKAEILAKADRLDAYSQTFVDTAFLSWVSDAFGSDALTQLNELLEHRVITSEDWYTVTGNTPAVLYDRYSGALDPSSPHYRSDIRVIETDSKDTVIRIVGDVSFADNWYIAPKIGQNGIRDVVSEEVLDLLTNADIFLVNNEFTYSTRGKPLNKTYTFRAHPNNVRYMLDMGADVVSLANNHAYDYGAEAFADTLQTLRDANLPYIGGGENIKEAAKPFYFIVNGRKYAFSAATRAEKTIRTPQAGENTSGVMRTYDAAKYLETIRTAERECDYNIVYVHWGAEGYHHIEDGLYEMGCSYIDAGADLVVGAHAHVLQGIQYYKDVPIVYNLGNFLFNANTMDTGILEVVIDAQGAPTYRFLPALQTRSCVYLKDGTKKQELLAFMETLSIDVHFAEDGTFTQK